MTDTPKTEPLADDELQEVTGGAQTGTNAFGATLVAGVDENDTGQSWCGDNGCDPGMHQHE